MSEESKAKSAANNATANLVKDALAKKAKAAADATKEASVPTDAAANAVKKASDAAVKAEAEAANKKVESITKSGDTAITLAK